MKIYQPLSHTYLSQGFYEDRACAKLGVDGRAIYPYQVVSKKGNFCPSGYSSIYKLFGKEGHGAYDLGAYFRQPVYFPAKAKDKDGIPMEWEVLERNDDAGSGLGMVVISKRPVKFHIGWLGSVGKQAQNQWANNGGAIYCKFTFWHAHKNDKDDKRGTPVEFGEKIQEANSTGASSGHHVHFSLKLCNADGNTYDKNNGYGGAVDYTKIYKSRFVLNVLGRKEVIDGRQQIDRAIFILRTFTKDLRGAILLSKVKKVLEAFLGRN